jgi:hypothetical protein
VVFISTKDHDNLIIVKEKNGEKLGMGSKVVIYGSTLFSYNGSGSLLQPPLSPLLIQHLIIIYLCILILIIYGT